MGAMNDQEMPYFMTNKDWYTENSDETSLYGLLLTENAPKEAIESYREFYAGVELGEDGVFCI